MRGDLCLCCGALSVCVFPLVYMDCDRSRYKQHRELDRCIEAWLEKRYGAELATRKRETLSQLQRLRAESLKIIGTGGRVASDDASLRTLFAYYHCLSALDLPFGEDESQGLLRVRFEWTAAYKSDERMKAYTPQVERVAVLFNAACAMSARACEQSDAIRGGGSAEEWKAQCHTFRAAAGVFQHIKEYAPKKALATSTLRILDPEGTPATDVCHEKRLVRNHFQEQLGEKGY